MKLKPNQFTVPNGQVITENPILFQTEMVKAILEGRKTQTRRTKGLESINADPDFWNRKGDPRKNTVRMWDSTKECNPNPLAIHFGFKDPIDSIAYIKSQYGKPGDLLWVSETYTKTPDFGYAYKANMSHDSEDLRKNYLKTKGNEWAKWKPSIHMPKSAARIWMMIEDIRVERLWDITEADAKAEGVQYIESDNFFKKGWKNYNLTDLDDPNFHTALLSFESLWLKINGEDSFQSNPWLWVIQFRVLSKVGRPSMEVIEQAYSDIRNLKSEISHAQAE